MIHKVYSIDVSDDGHNVKMLSFEVEEYTVINGGRTFYKVITELPSWSSFFEGQNLLEHEITFSPSEAKKRYIKNARKGINEKLSSISRVIKRIALVEKLDE